ncbi:hypothetical protein ACFL2C_01870 [Patescibacteria group bacterium]
MLVTTHAITGAAISSIVPNPIMSVPIAFGSHFVLDAIPHYDPDLKKATKDKLLAGFLVADIIIAAAVSMTLIIATNNPTIIYGVIAATIMDIDVIFYLKKSFPKPLPKSLSRFHYKVQNETKNKYLGFITQALVIIGGVVVICVLSAN